MIGLARAVTPCSRSVPADWRDRMQAISLRRFGLACTPAFTVLTDVVKLDLAFDRFRSDSARSLLARPYGRHVGPSGFVTM